MTEQLFLDPSVIQQYIAYSIALFFVLFVLGAYKMSQTAGLDDYQIEHIKSLKASRESANRVYVQVTDSDDIRSKIRGAIEGTVETTSEWVTVRKRILSKYQYASSLTVKATIEAVIYVASGLLLLTSIDTLEAIARGGDGLDLQVVLNSLTSSFEAITGLSMSSPVFEFLYGISLAYMIQFAELVYNNPVTVALTMVAFAGVLAYIYRQNELVREIDTKPYTASKRGILSVFGVSFVALWVSSVVPYTIFESIGYSSIGSILSAVLSVASLVGITLGIAAWLYGKSGLFTKEILDSDIDVDADVAMRYYLSETILKVISVAVFPILVLYIIQLLVSGRLFEVVQIIIGASLQVKILIALLGAVLIGFVVYSIADVLDGTKMMFRKLAQRYQLRARAAYDALPFIAVFVIGLSVYLSETNILVAVGLGVLGAILIRAIAYVLYRTKVRAYKANSNQKERSIAYISAYTVEDAADREYDVVEINNDYKLLSDDESRLVDDSVECIETYFDHAYVPFTLSEYHYDRSFDYGLGHEDVEDAMRNEAREAILHTLMRNGGQVDRTKLDGLKETLDDSIYEKELRQLQQNRRIRTVRDQVVLIDESQYDEGVVDKIVRAVLG